MNELLEYEKCEGFSRIIIDDGKVNAMSIAMLKALHTAFDQAESDGVPVVLTAQGKVFSAGFDLKVFRNGSASDIYTMLRSGSELALRLLQFPFPVVTACDGAAFPMGAFLILSADYRLAAEGAYKIGMNEVTIGLTVPRFATEIARQRLTPAYFSRSIVTGEMFQPAEALIAGYFDRIVPNTDLQRTAEATARSLGEIDLVAHHQSKLRARSTAIKAIRDVIDTDITMNYAEERVAWRDGQS